MFWPASSQEMLSLSSTSSYPSSVLPEASNLTPESDWFRLETLDDSLQPTIDMLLNLSVFMWFGAVCPWFEFAHNDVIPIYRLVFLGILILLFRRIPIILALHKKIHQIEEFQQAAFVGFFGPIGVSAVFYLYISVDFLSQVKDENGVVREDAEKLSKTIYIVVWFLAICSIVRLHLSRRPSPFPINTHLRTNIHRSSTVSPFPSAN
jgi:NhaP-type Na+/H+ or K+/H+ antiporter